MDFKKLVPFLALLLGLSWCGRDGVRASGFGSGVPAPVQVLTAHADNLRDGWYSTERILTPANVGGGTFGKLHTWSLSTGAVMAQLLIVPGVVTSGGQKDLLIAVGLSGTVFALDANNFSASPVWTAAMGTGTGYNPSASLLYNQTVACISTPVADPVGGYLYVSCVSSTPVWSLYQLNLATGATVATATITGQYPGTGDPNGGDTIIDGELQFKPNSHMNRAALTLANGNVYIPFASYADDAHPWHGWIFSVATSNMSVANVISINPSDYGAGVWGSSAGLSVDASGNLYAFTGNGGYDGSTAFGESIIKLSSSLSVLDWFTPSNWATLEAADYDLSSSRAILMRTANGSPLLAGGAKDGRIYVVDSTCLGHLQGSGSGCTAPQLWYTVQSGQNNTGIYGGAFGNSTLFVPNVAGNIYAYSFSPSTGLFNQTPVKSSATFAFPGAQLSFSSNGPVNGILWAATTATSALTSAQAGTLRAFDPVTMAELYNSDATSGDTLGTLNKFNSPVVWNGQVYIGAGTTVEVYGLGAH